VTAFHAEVEASVADVQGGTDQRTLPCADVPRLLAHLAGFKLEEPLIADGASHDSVPFFGAVGFDAVDGPRLEALRDELLECLAGLEPPDLRPKAHRVGDDDVADTEVSGAFHDYPAFLSDAA